MKNETVLKNFIKGFGYVIGFVGVLFAIGSVGAHEWNTITTFQLIVQEFIALIVIYLGFIVYNIGKYFNYLKK